MTDINTLIKALRCSASPYTDNKNCTECQYGLLEEVKDDYLYLMMQRLTARNTG